MKYKLITHAAAVAAVLVLMPLCLIAEESARQDIALRYLEGTVRLQKPESEGWMTAESSMVLVPGDKIQTSNESRAELAIAADKSIRIDQNSTIALKKYPDSLSILPTTINLVQGDFWGQFSGLDTLFELVCPLKSGNSLNLKCPDTTFAIFRIGIGADSTFEARLYDGTMIIFFSKPDSLRDSLNSGYYHSSNSVLLKSSEKILISSSGKIVFKGAFSPDDIDEKTEWVEWNKTRDTGAAK